MAVGMEWMVERIEKLGATQEEISAFKEFERTIEEYSLTIGFLVRMDRTGVIAAQKAKRAAARKNASTPTFKIANATRARIWAALKGRTDGALFSKLKYSIEDLMAHLEASFVDGMTWDNYGSWHIDHIKPCVAFDQTNPSEFDECWSLANLQPLWARDNIRKGARYG